MRFTARADACSVGTMRSAGADAGGELELFGDEGEVASTCCARFGAERQPGEVRRMAPAPEIAAPAAYICRRCRQIPDAKSLAPALRIIAAIMSQFLVILPFGSEPIEQNTRIPC